MYLDNSSIEDASGVYPIDDDDYASASGSGKAEDCFTLTSLLHTSPHPSWNLLQRHRQGVQWLRACSVESKCLGMNSGSSSPQLSDLRSVFNLAEPQFFSFIEWKVSTTLACWED